MNLGDLKVYKSSLPDSIGGVISPIQVQEPSLSSLFPDVKKDDLVKGGTFYRKAFLKNGGADTLTSGVIWLVMQPSDTQGVSIAMGTDSDNDPMTVENFVSPEAQENGLSIGTLNPGDSVGVWFKVVIGAATPEFKGRTFFQLAVAGA